MSEQLPECFEAKCRKCGWLGWSSELHSMLYVVGTNSLLADPDTWNVSRCPGCNHRLEYRVDEEALTGRYDWSVQHTDIYPDEEFFPCKCGKVVNPRRVTPIRIKLSTFGDTAFVNDETWIRLLATLVCSSCQASGLVAVIEKHPNEVSEPLYKLEYAQKYQDLHQKRRQEFEAWWDNTGLPKLAVHEHAFPETMLESVRQIAYTAFKLGAGLL